MSSPRSTSKDYHRLYKTARWKRLRATHLAKRPWCECPHHKGKHVEANVVDHITPHKGDTRKFYDPLNLQAMTKECHDKFKASQERGGPGFDQGCDTQGNPLNSQEHWK